MHSLPLECRNPNDFQSYVKASSSNLLISIPAICDSTAPQSSFSSDASLALLCHKHIKTTNAFESKVKSSVIVIRQSKDCLFLLDFLFDAVRFV